MTSKAGVRPRFQPPPLSCDAHCHIVGPRSRFPILEAARAREAHDAPKETLEAMHRSLGIDRAVIVQSGLHGLDLSVTVEALAWARGRWRGVALVKTSISAHRLEDLHDAGFRGIRHNLANRAPGSLEPDSFLALDEKIAPLGWHALFHMRADQIGEIAPTMRRLRAPIVFDHFMRLDPSQPVRSELELLCGFLRSGAWIKLAAVDKLSRRPYPHPDAIELAHLLLDLAPDRALWGTDWPHPDGRGLRGDLRPDDRELLELVPLYAPDPERQRKLLVDNPARLYGFS